MTIIVLNIIKPGGPPGREAAPEDGEQMVRRGDGVGLVKAE